MERRPVFVSLMALAGCRQVFGLDDLPAVDGPVAGDGAMPDAQTCTWSPFSPPIQMTDVSHRHYDETAPWLSADGLELFLARAMCTTTDFDIFRATRANSAVSFGAPVLNSQLSANNVVDVDPFLSDDGLTIWYARGPAASRDILSSTRTSRAAPFGVPQVVAELDSSGGNGGPSLRRDLLEIVFSSSRPGSQGFDLYMATRADTASAFGAPVVVLSAPGDDLAPVLSADGNELIFVRGGSLVISKRENGAFMPPIPLFNPSFPATDPAWSHDGTTILFAQPVTGGECPNTDLYITTRTCEL